MARRAKGPVSRFVDGMLRRAGLQRVGGGGGRRGAYAAAAVNRLTADWIRAPIESANREMQADLLRLRGRSREQSRNNGLYRRWLHYSARNIVGKEIRLQMQLVRNDGKRDTANNLLIQRHWARWATWSRMASADGKQTLHGLARLGIVARRRDGDALFQILRGAPNRYGLALKQLDADQLDHTYERAASTAPDGTRINEIRLGIEVDEHLAPVAYHLWTRHPTEWGTPAQRVPVPAADIIHLFKAERPGQVRGIPEAHAVLLDAKMLAGYKEAELIAARTASAKMGFFIGGDDAEQDPNEEEDAADDELPVEAEAGTFGRVPAGYTFEQFDPQHPVAAYGDFVKAGKRDLATGLDVAYATFFGDLEAVNYSSGKLGLADERDMWRLEQDDLAIAFYDRVFGEWLKMGILSEALPFAPDQRDALHEGATWRPRGWVPVDALKEAQATAIDLALAQTTFQEQCALRGVDFEENIADLAEAYAIAEAAGVTLSTDLPTPPTTGDDDANPAHRPARAFRVAS